jgi:hypothetical protein
MISMWMLKGKKHVVFENNTDEGKYSLELIRKYYPEKFKYARITNVIQAYPNKVQIGEITEWTY